ncbi:winged helix-turn-helix transcriptional regulator [Bdellovibrio bacteriovorus]|uniref:winged helix-turn-helix transcriptional regulator n=1 Tax=Bdellovibrio TaxID=958 RepID=UPI0035A8406D
MQKKKKKLRSHCPVNFGLEAFGDKWALLILRDIIFRGKKTFGEFLKSEEKFATNILTSRLEHLVEERILTKEPLAEDSRKDAYLLTEKGLDLIPVIFEITLWSFKYDNKSEAKRIRSLVELIKSDNRAISKTIREKVKRGEGIVMDYVEK